MSQTADPIAPAATMPEPEWIRVKQAVTWSGLGRTIIYHMMDSGKIKSVSMRERGMTKGTRLISFASLKGFLESRATGGDAA
jgi:hypothetical protein